MEYGLIAAIGWGISSVAATHAARRMGTLVALLASQVTGTIVLAVVLAAIHPHLLVLPGAAVLGLAGAGFLSLVGWLTYYRALEYGPVGIVSGTAATYGGVTALLAMLVLGEPLGAAVREPVVATKPAVDDLLAIHLDEPVLAKALKGGVQRAGAQLDPPVRDLLDVGDDPVAMLAASGQRGQDQEGRLVYRLLAHRLTIYRAT